MGQKIKQVTIRSDHPCGRCPWSISSRHTPPPTPGVTPNCYRKVGGRGILFYLLTLRGMFALSYTR